MQPVQALVVVDRIEGDVAVLDWDGVDVNLPVSLLPEGVSEGNAFRITLDPASDEEARLHQAIKVKLEELASGDDGGDLDL